MNSPCTPHRTVRDFVHQQLLEHTSELIKLCRSNDDGPEFLSARYNFLWFTSLADAEALEAAYELMCKDGACFEMPIDSNAVFGNREFFSQPLGSL